MAEGWSPLPIDAVLPALTEAVAKAGCAVLQAPPGAGKTTRVPLALLPQVRGRIVMLEPRRLAARAAAERLAAWLEEPRRLASVNEAQQLSDSYLKSFNEMAATALEMNRLAFVSMSALAGEFDGLAKETVRTWTTNLEDTKQKTLSRVDTTIRGSIALSGLALILGMALAWLIARPGLTAPIVSATSLEQLKDLTAAARLILDRASIDRLDKASGG